eukprot:6181137-Pleurochrysis_carterae.AAC.2
MSWRYPSRASFRSSMAMPAGSGAGKFSSSLFPFSPSSSLKPPSKAAPVLPRASAEHQQLLLLRHQSLNTPQPKTIKCS